MNQVVALQNRQTIRNCCCGSHNNKMERMPVSRCSMEQEINDIGKLPEMSSAQTELKASMCRILQQTMVTLGPTHQTSNYNAQERLEERDDSVQQRDDSLLVIQSENNEFSGSIDNSYSPRFYYEQARSQRQRGPPFSRLNEHCHDSSHYPVGTKIDFDFDEQERQHQGERNALYCDCASLTTDKNTIGEEESTIASNSDFNDESWSQCSDLSRSLHSDASDEDSILSDTSSSYPGSFASWIVDNDETAPLKRQSAGSTMPSSWTIQVLDDLVDENGIGFEVYPNDSPHPTSLLLQGDEIMDMVQTLLLQQQQGKEEEEEDGGSITTDRGNPNRGGAGSFHIRFQASGVSLVVGRDEILDRCRSLLLLLFAGGIGQQRRRRW